MIRSRLRRKVGAEWAPTATACQRRAAVTPDRGATWAKLTVTEARHATFQMKHDDKQSFGIIYILLEKP